MPDTQAISLAGAADAARVAKAERELPYVAATTFDVFALPGDGFIGRSRKRDDETVIGYQHGPTQRAVPLSVVAAGIAAGVLTPDDILTLWGIAPDHKLRKDVATALSA